jgi:hypothetical protein
MGQSNFRPLPAIFNAPQRASGIFTARIRTSSPVFHAPRGFSKPAENPPAEDYVVSALLNHAVADRLPDAVRAGDRVELRPAIFSDGVHSRRYSMSRLSMLNVRFLRYEPGNLTENTQLTPPLPHHRSPERQNAIIRNDPTSKKNRPILALSGSSLLPGRQRRSSPNRGHGDGLKYLPHG